MRLVWDADHPLVSDEEVRAHLREYSGAAQQEARAAGPRPPIWVDLASLEGHGGEVKPNAHMEKIEVWLKRFQDVEDGKQRSDLRGPLNGV